jgi:hypothetical protein
MFGIHRRPNGRLFLLVTILIAIVASAQSGPPLTVVQDTVYRADGTPAQGTLLISWPAFTTANNQAVAAGSTSVTLGSNGSLSVSLISNASSTPASNVYRVIYQLNDPL